MIIFSDSAPLVSRPVFANAFTAQCKHVMTTTTTTRGTRRQREEKRLNRLQKARSKNEPKTTEQVAMALAATFSDVCIALSLSLYLCVCERV